MREDISLNDAVDSGNFGTLVLKDDADGVDYDGFVININHNFLVLQSIEIWHNDGYMIFPIKFVDKFNVFDTHYDKARILEWNNSIRATKLDWIDISAFEKLFRSLMEKTNVVMIEDSEDAEVGQIVEIQTDCVIIKTIDGGGCWMDNLLSFDYDEIISVSFGGEYISILRSFAESNAKSIASRSEN